ncbi:MAG: DUF1508 domain-containing protein [Oceanospirillaceae bacterium]|nr:DUF1508 domain-containing protein [Oceanospirillaceae bacterium]MBT13897.1 DUF1508 domain-containing protein [Oceanospirillaceae bacterium]|tara:strand:+ start:80 stop:412 length:333 start_codon:yes stop_codon:yes gene_type:complete
MPGTFRVVTENEGFFQFEYLNPKGELLMTSPAFEGKEMIDKAIQDTRVGSMMSQFIAKGQTADGGLFFMIKDSGGLPVARSILFSDEMLFNNALHTVRDDACIAAVDYAS